MVMTYLSAHFHSLYVAGSSTCSYCFAGQYSIVQGLSHKMGWMYISYAYYIL